MHDVLDRADRQQEVWPPARTGRPRNVEMRRRHHEPDAHPLPGPARHDHVAAEPLDLLLDDGQPEASAGDVGDDEARAHAGPLDERERGLVARGLG